MKCSRTPSQCVEWSVLADLQLSCTLLNLTLWVEVRSVFSLRCFVVFTSCQQLCESLPSEAEESQKRSRVGRLAAGICAAVSLHPVHAGPTCYREPPPWHEQALTAVWSVLLPDRRRWGFWGLCHLTWNTSSYSSSSSSSSRRRFESQIRSGEKSIFITTEQPAIRGCQSALMEII